MVKMGRMVRWTMWCIVVPVGVALLATLRMRWAERPPAGMSSEYTGACDGTCELARTLLFYIMYGWPLLLVVWAIAVIRILVRRS